MFRSSSVNLSLHKHLAPRSAEVDQHKCNPVVSTRRKYWGGRTACAAAQDSPRQQPSSRLIAMQKKDELSQTKVLLFVPNLVGYCRLGFLGASLLTGTSRPALTVSLFLANFALDGVDGLLARALQQTSAFGAFLDVAIDCISRGALYAWAIQGPASAFLIALEFLTFVVTHKGGGAAWKSGCFSGAPGWVAAVMAQNFRTPIGALAIAGLMGMPLWLWVRRYYAASWLAAWQLGAAFLVGRALAASVEVWVLVRHIQGLLLEDVQQCAAADS